MYSPVLDGGNLPHRWPKRASLLHFLRRGTRHDLKHYIGIERDEHLAIDRGIRVVTGFDDVLPAGEDQKIVPEVPRSHAVQGGGGAARDGSDYRAATYAPANRVKLSPQPALRRRGLFRLADHLAELLDRRENVVQPIELDVHEPDAHRTG